MDANLTYDAKRAYHHIRQLAFPRLVGSTGEADARAYIVEQFDTLGLEVSQEGFSFSKFPAEVLPRILCGLLIPVVLSVPWLSDQFPIPVCLASLLSLCIVMFFTQWHQRFEGLYDVGRKHESENIVATNGIKQEGNTPALLFVAHYDSKSQVLPIVVRAAAYFLAIVGLVGLTTATTIKIFILVSLSNNIVWSIAGITVFCLLVLQINLTQNRSPGGFDNASGVGVMLEVARVVMARDEKKSITFLAAGAEEYGMCGALRYIQKHANKYSRDHTSVINLDGLGVGSSVNAITRYGIPSVRTSRRLAERFKTSGESLNIKVSERKLPFGIGLDSIPIASYGFEVVTLTAGEVGKVALKIHSAQDRSDLLDVDSLQQVGVLIVDVIERA